MDPFSPNPITTHMAYAVPAQHTAGIKHPRCPIAYWWDQGSGYLCQRNIQITWLGFLLITSCQTSPSCFCAQSNSLGWTEQTPQQAIWFGSEDISSQDDTWLLPACIISACLTTNNSNQLLGSPICTSRSGDDLEPSPPRVASQQ